jgi:hypothetical protein
MMDKPLVIENNQVEPRAVYPSQPKLYDTFSEAIFGSKTIIDFHALTIRL